MTSASQVAKKAVVADGVDSFLKGCTVRKSSGCLLLNILGPPSFISATIFTAASPSFVGNRSIQLANAVMPCAWEPSSATAYCDPLAASSEK